MRWTIPEQPDLLEQGGGRPPRRWPVVVVAVVAVLALVGYGVVRQAQRRPPSASDAVSSLSASPPSTAPSGPNGLPMTTGACGAQASRMFMNADPVDERTGVRLLVGGAQVALVDVDSGQVVPRSQVPDADHNQAQTLVRHGADVYALVAPCEGPRPGRVVGVDAKGEVRRVPMSGPVDGLIGGPAGVYGVDYPPDDATPGAGSAVQLRPVGGGTVSVDGDLSPLGVTSAGVVALANGEHADGEPPQVVLLDRSTGHVTRTIAGGYPLGVSGDAVIWHGKACRYLATGPAARCVLHATDVGGADRSYRLPTGRTPASDVVASADGRFVALQISDSRTDSRYTGGHPGPPSELAVLDLGSGRLRIVPGLELPPKAGAGLAFTPDDRWLAATVSEGDHGHLLLWRVGTARALRTDVRLAGPLASAPPVVALR
ncbi:MAG: hypothetical protein J2P24_12010 [Streptosporangiales bacterium]|nr:hypothetical protein [Streptosporangiales bacterium]MBO0891451.1 hypothetical protein [Acidothermales bacterium]